MYRRLARSGLINLVNLSTNIVIGLVLTPVFIQQLGATYYGLWVLVLSLSVVRGFLVVFNLGIQGSIVKYVAEFEAKDDAQAIRETVSAGLVAYLIIGGCIGVVVGLVAVFATGTLTDLFNIPTELIPIAQALFLYLALQTLFDFPAMAVSGLLEGLQRYDVVYGFNIVRLIIFAGCSVLLIAAGWGVFALAAATFLSELARLVGHIYWVRRIYPAFHLTRHITRGMVRKLSTFSLQLLVYSLIDQVYNQMDKLIIAIFLTTTHLTYYDISYRLQTLVFSLTTIIGPLVLPAAAALQAHDNLGEQRRLLVRATRYSAALTVPVALIVMVLAEPLTLAWIGPEYQSTATTTRLFIVYILIWAVMRVGSNMLIGINQVKFVLVAFGATTLINLVISIVLVQSLGIDGVVLGTVIAHGLLIVPYLWLFHRHLGLQLRDFVNDIVLRVYPQAVIAAGVVVMLMSLRPASGLAEVGLYGATGLAVFVILFVLTGMPSDERKAAGQFIKTRFGELRLRADSR